MIRVKRKETENAPEYIAVNKKFKTDIYHRVSIGTCGNALDRVIAKFEPLRIEMDRLRLEKRDNESLNSSECEDILDDDDITFDYYRICENDDVPYAGLKELDEEEIAYVDEQEHDSEDGFYEDDVDSNAENYYGNDYPDEESSCGYSDQTWDDEYDDNEDFY